MVRAYKTFKVTRFAICWKGPKIRTLLSCNFVRAVYNYHRIQINIVCYRYTVIFICVFHSYNLYIPNFLLIFPSFLFQIKELYITQLNPNSRYPMSKL